ncbi:MAG: tetratricopeptide repeat protein, partial [Verrucomicrobia bacterium]
NCENWYVLGEKLEEKGETEKAIASYQQVIKLNPNQCECYIKLAEIFTKQQKKSEAIEVYRQSIEFNCYSPDLYGNLGYMLLENGDISQAIENFEKAIHIKKFDCPELLFKLAVLLRNNKQYEKSISYCRKAVALFSENINFRYLMADLLIVTGKLDEGRKCYYDLAKIKLNKERVGGKIGTVFLCILPKSGTEYIRYSLSKGLNMPNHKLNVYSRGFGVNSTDFLTYNATVKIWEYYSKSEPEVNVAHLTPDKWNKFFIGCITDKLVVHVKDPRQGLLSWIHHILRARQNFNMDQLELFRHYTLGDAGYFDMSPTAQIDYQIDSENGYLPYAIKWIEGWLEAAEDPNLPLRILFTKFEDLATQPKIFFENILDFYEVEKSSFTFPEPPQFKQGTRYRKGSTDEWREVFTSEQKEKATKMISKRLLDRFGWPER